MGYRDSRGTAVNPTVWFLATAGLGLLALALMYLFVAACDRV